jgi:hypothetical protein
MKLADKMRQIAETIPTVDYPAYATTREEAEENVRQYEKLNAIAEGLTRVVAYPDKNVESKYRIATVVLTLDEHVTPNRWNFSTSDPVNATKENGPNRVADDLAFLLAEAFLGTGYEEIPPEGYWKNVRQFTKART